jgi:hypothetical protein
MIVPGPAAASCRRLVVDGGTVVVLTAGVTVLGTKVHEALTGNPVQVNEIGSAKLPDVIVVIAMAALSPCASVTELGLRVNPKSATADVTVMAAEVEAE